jgi:hypothetical protein
MRQAKRVHRQIYNEKISPSTAFALDHGISGYTTARRARITAAFVDNEVGRRRAATGTPTIATIFVNGSSTI